MLKLKVISPEKVIFSGNVDSVLVPGTLGSFEILTGHAPIISTLEKGIVEYGTEGKKTRMQIIGGFVEVKKNEVSLCVDQ